MPDIFIVVTPAFSGVMASRSGVAFANTGPGMDPASDMVTASAADQLRYGGDSSWR
jgi:hypothetical protein